MTGTDLVYAAASLDERKQYAAAIARAGELLPKSLYETVKYDDGHQEQRPSAGKVLLIAETGNMLGIHPIAALNGVNVIEGKPTIAPALMRALIQRAGHKVRVREAGTIEGGDYAVTVTIIRSDDPDAPYASTWTPQKAQRAGLCQYAYDQTSKQWRVTAQSRQGNPLPWQQYPEALCLARASREAANMGASDVIFGIYTPEELGATVNEAGELVDITATAIVRTPAIEPEESPGLSEADVVEQAPYDQTEADEWAAQIAAATESGDRDDTVDSDTLRGVYLRAIAAGVHEHWADDPARVDKPKTIEQLIADRHAQLQKRARS